MVRDWSAASTPKRSVPPGMDVDVPSGDEIAAELEAVPQRRRASGGLTATGRRDHTRIVGLDQVVA